MIPGLLKDELDGEMGIRIWPTIESFAGDTLVSKGWYS
jgi:hypothetical protein